MSIYMKIAFEEAKKAYNIDEVPIGAVITKSNQIISQSHNKNISQCDSTSHAEILAIKDACKELNSNYLRDCDIYITLEPCPMCAYAISLARIKRIYYSIPDPKFGGISALFNKNCHHRPEIYDNIGDSSKYKQLLQKFFNKKR